MVYLWFKCISLVYGSFYTLIFSWLDLFACVEWLSVQVWTWGTSYPEPQTGWLLRFFVVALTSGPYKYTKDVFKFVGETYTHKRERKQKKVPEHRSRYYIPNTYPHMIIVAFVLVVDYVGEAAWLVVIVLVSMYRLQSVMNGEAAGEEKEVMGRLGLGLVRRC